MIAEDRDVRVADDRIADVSAPGGDAGPGVEAGPGVAHDVISFQCESRIVAG